MRPLRSDCAVKAEARLRSRKNRVVIVTGSSTEMLWNPWTRAMLSNKQAYAAAHGYEFELAISDLFMLSQEGLDPNGLQKFRGEFLKVLMVWEAMIRHLEADWIVLADHDVWFHPSALTNASLDLYLDTIPEHKLFAHANYHSLNTGIVFIRQGVLGRDLVMKLWSVLSSGLIGSGTLLGVSCGCAAEAAWLLSNPLGPAEQDHLLTACLLSLPQPWAMMHVLQESVQMMVTKEPSLVVQCQLPELTCGDFTPAYTM